MNSRKLAWVWVVFSFALFLSCGDKTQKQQEEAISEQRKAELREEFNREKVCDSVLFSVFDYNSNAPIINADYLTKDFGLGYSDYSTDIDVIVFPFIRVGDYYILKFCSYTLWEYSQKTELLTIEYAGFKINVSDSLVGVSSGIHISLPYLEKKKDIVYLLLKVVDKGFEMVFENEMLDIVNDFLECSLTFDEFYRFTIEDVLDNSEYVINKIDSIVNN